MQYHLKHLCGVMFLCSLLFFLMQRFGLYLYHSDQFLLKTSFLFTSFFYDFFWLLEIPWPFDSQLTQSNLIHQDKNCVLFFFIGLLALLCSLLVHWLVFCAGWSLLCWFFDLRNFLHRSN